MCAVCTEECFFSLVRSFVVREFLFFLPFSEQTEKNQPIQINVGSSQICRRSTTTLLLEVLLLLNFIDLVSLRKNFWLRRVNTSTRFMHRILHRSILPFARKKQRQRMLHHAREMYFLGRLYVIYFHLCRCRISR